MYFRSRPPDPSHEGAMKQILSTITSMGQVTVPAEVRRHLGLAAHDHVAFIIEADGTVRLSSPQRATVKSLRGAAGTLPHPMSWHEMREIAYKDRIQT